MPVDVLDFTRHFRFPPRFSIWSCNLAGKPSSLNILELRNQLLCLSTHEIAATFLVILLWRLYVLSFRWFLISPAIIAKHISDLLNQTCLCISLIMFRFTCGRGLIFFPLTATLLCFGDSLSPYNLVGLTCAVLNFCQMGHPD
jgi:hypothetical protein